MTREAHQLVRGYVTDFSIKKVFNQGIARFDVEISLSNEWREEATKTVMRFMDARNVCYGDSHAGIDFGAYVCLNVQDVSNDGWDGVRFKADNIEGDCRLSLYCRSFDVEEVSRVSLPDACTVLL